MQKDNLTKNSGSSAVKRKKMALGRGLGALIPGIEKTWEIEEIAGKEKGFERGDHQQP
mgnify:CR=1 FL=1